MAKKKVVFITYSHGPELIVTTPEHDVDALQSYFADNNVHLNDPEQFDREEHMDTYLGVSFNVRVD